jgi:hypothetical protein
VGKGKARVKPWPPKNLTSRPPTLPLHTLLPPPARGPKTPSSAHEAVSGCHSKLIVERVLTSNDPNNDLGTGHQSEQLNTVKKYSTCRGLIKSIEEQDDKF